MNYESPRLGSLLGKLSGVKKTGPGRYISNCPAHDDRSPSLAITEIDEKILVHDFGGCTVSSVLDAVGLEMSDLFPPRLNINSVKSARFNAYDVLQCLKNEAGIYSLGRV